MSDSTRDEVFYPNACHVCRAFGKDTRLKRCGSCKLIAYCNREHQKSHWPEHKEFCRVASGIAKKCGTVHGVGKNWENDEKSWMESKMNLTTLLGLSLGRQLSRNEIEMLQYPRCCEICHETDPRKLSDCLDCPSASFCQKHPKDEKHFAKCKTSKLSFETDNAIFDFGYVHVVSNSGKSVPKTMDEALGLFAADYRSDISLMSKNTWATILSNKLSRPYTLLYAMEKLARPRTQKMTVHVLGSCIYDMYYVNFWTCLLHHDLPLKELRMVLVGPELMTNTTRLKCCDSCKAKKRRITLQYVGAMYEDYAVSSTFSKPDYVIGFNLGIDERASLKIEDWAPAIKTLAKLDCPFFMTSFTAEEAKADQERINSFLDGEAKVFWAGENPFYGLKPYKDFRKADFFYQNYYLTIYEKLS